MVRTMVSGTPSAVPLRPPKLERMSLRTTPEVVSTLGPFDPSPGNGPAVSFGTSAHVVDPLAPVVPVAAVASVAAAALTAPGEVAVSPQPNSVKAPAAVV